MLDMMSKVEAVRAYLDEHGLTPLVEVDGGITTQTLPIAWSHGANTFVAGSSVFGHGAPAQNISDLRESLPPHERNTA